MRRTAAGIVAGLIAGSLFIAGNADATVRTAPTVHIDNVDPTNTARIGVQRGHLTFEITSDASQVTLTLTPPTGTSPNQWRVLPGHQDGQKWTFHAIFRKSAPAGTWLATATATSGGESSTDKTTVYTSYRSRISQFRVHPRIVREGKPIYFSGRLEYNVNGRWKPLANTTVTIFAREDRKVDVDTTTDGRGRFYTWTTAATSDLFFAYYHGVNVGGTDAPIETTEADKVPVKVLPKK
ncbi:hypothetical protein J5X84_15160 [Streptosporangiaceae bacterium NEAU-GS5]|nr:hypothetical protein [Streptosporangiaceae bacterium NEAU-GS5]